jgi:DNA gyrase subunit A
VANLLAFQPGEQIAQVLDLRDYDNFPYLVLATRQGLVKKTRLTDYDSNRSGGLIAVNLREGDELVGAGLAAAEDDLILVSVKGQSVRFHATDDTLRPMGRSTSGVTGMKFRGGDHLLSMSVVRESTDPDLFVVFENGLAKRTASSDYPVKGRATLGVKVAQLSERGGDLVGALTVDEDDEVMVVMEKGKVVRSRVDEVRRTGRNTMGVQFATPDRGDAIVAVARNTERLVEAEVEAVVEGAEESGALDGDGDVAGQDTSAGQGASQVDAVPSEESGPEQASAAETTDADEPDAGGNQ